MSAKLFLFAAMTALLLVLSLGATASAADKTERDLEIAKSMSNAYATVVERVAPAVVSIKTETIVKRAAPELDMPSDEWDDLLDRDMLRRFFRRMPRGVPQAPERSGGVGSGIIIDKEGHILTNNHVVKDADRIKVELADRKEPFEAKVVGTDPNSDLAVIKLVDAPSNLPTVRLGDSDAMRAGNIVIAIGSPPGDFKNTVTVGGVSATGRTLDTGKNYQMEEMIQTDAAINQGNSGGPLVNLAGEVIGINTIIVRGSGYSSAVAEGLGFAIPSNTAAMVANQIIQNGRVARPYIGINWQWVTPRLASYYDLPVKWGAYVSEIDWNGPARQAGIQRGDIITQIGEIALDSDHPYINALFNYSPGQTIPITVARGNQIITLQVTLDEQTY
jgi:2-alkenal reductase